MEVVENLPRTLTMVPTKSNKKDKKRSREHESDNGNKSEATKDSTKAYDGKKKRRVERTK